MSVTMEQIAQRVGVSRVTVSEVLRGVGRSSAATRERVQRVARQLGYRPSSSARAIRTGRTGALALLMSTIVGRSALPTALPEGIYGAVAEHDLQLIVSQLTEEHLADRAFVPKVLRERLADGLLLNHAFQIPPRLTTLVERLRIPAIWLNRRSEADAVYADDVEAARLVTHRLIDLGHLGVAFADYHHGSGPVTTEVGRERRAGYEQAMHERGLRPIWLTELRPLHNAADPPSHGRHGWRLEYTLQWLKEPLRPTAVVAFGPETALPILVGAERLGIGLGRHLSLVSLGAEPLWQTSMAIASTVLPGKAMGWAAVECLLRKIEAPAERQPARVFQYELRESHTVGPPR